MYETALRRKARRQARHVYDSTQPSTLKTGTREADYAVPVFFLLLALASFCWILWYCSRWLLDQ